jgi:hypothetical protein
MTKDQVKAILGRVPTCPEDRQQQLAEIAVEIEAELAGTDHEATPDEVATIDKGLTGGVASEAEVEAAFASLRKASGSNIRSGPLPIFDKLSPISSDR